MDPIMEQRRHLTRRQLFGRTAGRMGAAALASLVGNSAAGGSDAQSLNRRAEFPNFAPRARRVIYLFQSGAPSQLDLFDYKPQLAARHREELPESIRKG